jgi:outer membrane protein assembly factor BamB
MRYSLAGSAMVAGLFCVLAVVLMVSNHRLMARYDPLNDAARKQIGAIIHAEGGEATRQQVRQDDLVTRRQYFRAQSFAQWGSYILIAGAATLVVSLKLLMRTQVRPPALPSAQPVPAPLLARSAALARWSVSLVALLLGAVALGLALTGRAQLVRALPGGAAESGGANGLGTIVTAGPDFASEEEMARNWPRFRGPRGDGVATVSNVPTQWDGRTGQGILWKTPLPLTGNNSPILWDNRIFLSGATDESREVYCFEADTGKPLWTQVVPTRKPASAPPTQTGEENGYATPTMATDGRRVFAIFATGDLACFDLDGHPLWNRYFGPIDSQNGYASSLSVAGKALLIQLDQAQAEDGRSAWVAVDTISGKNLYSKSRPVCASWTSPILAQTPSGPQLISVAKPWIMAHDPATGTEIWRVDGVGDDAAPSPTYSDGLAFAVSPNSKVWAIGTDGKGDISATHVRWSTGDGVPEICSPVVADDVLILLGSTGGLTCYQKTDGVKVWQRQLRKEFDASPSVAGGKLFLWSKQGRTLILSADRAAKELGQAKLMDVFHASPAFGESRIYMRGEKYLYCLDGTSPARPETASTDPDTEVPEGEAGGEAATPTEGPTTQPAAP